EIVLGGDGLHHWVGKPFPQRHHGRRVAAEGAIREGVDLINRQTHGASSRIRSFKPSLPRDRGRLGAARSGERRIRTGEHRFADWRSTSARAPNGRQSSAGTSAPFRSVVTHLARPRRAYAYRHQENS